MIEMTDELEEVRAHYGAVGLMQRLKGSGCFRPGKPATRPQKFSYA
jgi:hypothetical protein